MRWKLVPTDADMTDEQAEAIAGACGVCGGIAYDMYRHALAAAPSAADDPDVVENVAVGLAEEDGYWWDEIDEDEPNFGRDTYRKRARIALKAMEE